MEMFVFLERYVIDADTKAIYVLTLICIAMIIDFFSGTIAADDMTSNSKCRVIVLPNGNIQTKTKGGTTGYIYITMEYTVM